MSRLGDARGVGAGVDRARRVIVVSRALSLKKRGDGGMALERRVVACTVLIPQSDPELRSARPSRPPRESL
jgi:hypothetical protein